MTFFVKLVKRKVENFERKVHNYLSHILQIPGQDLEV
jgi:hypothetical protein